MAPKSIDVRDSINEWLVDNDRTLAWLQKKTDIPYGTLYSIFVQKNFNPSQEKLDVINEVLGTEFASA